MNIIIYTLVILTIFYLLLKKFTTISSKKISKSVRILMIIGLLLLATLFAVGGKFLLTLPLTLLSLALLKLKGLSLFQLISLFRLIQTLKNSGRFTFNNSKFTNFGDLIGNRFIDVSLNESDFRINSGVFLFDKQTSFNKIIVNDNFPLFKLSKKLDSLNDSEFKQHLIKKTKHFPYANFAMKDRESIIRWINHYHLNLTKDSTSIGNHFTYYLKVKK